MGQILKCAHQCLGRLCRSIQDGLKSSDLILIQEEALYRFASKTLQKGITQLLAVGGLRGGQSENVATGAGLAHAPTGQVRDLTQQVGFLVGAKAQILTQKFELLLCREINGGLKTAHGLPL